MTTTPDKIVYTARASVTGGRTGHATTEDGVLDLDLTAPKETGGPGTGTNPEQLFAVGYAACFRTALGSVAEKAGVSGADGIVLDSAVGFGPHESSFAITVELTGKVPGVDDATAQQLMEKAHEVCPYSKATRGNVPVTLVGRGV
ncbi:organic hydroperoxide resistance protein [Marmoricola endophyticus]|uniref:Organic hydroperoxide resistance protein n=1 Tax=Marmoricola endophyticus TaxID=2040280 RepID=A0A917BI48_9ACTN|nr:organic hydroperoxide resistance protein [Marmoricola endophyticus]GGF42542.1 organic hydroperoxide resistance protein [Marmoricola endophyticus]